MDGHNQIQKKCRLNNKRKNWPKLENQNKNNNNSRKNNKLNKQYKNNKNTNKNNRNQNKKLIKNNLHLQMLGMIWKIKIKRIV